MTLSFSLSFTIPGEPVGKPRMTQRDRWKVRKCVAAYRAWVDVARLSARMAGELPPLPGRVEARAYFSMPGSWSAKDRAQNAGLPHRSKPDVDNVTKALLDALFAQGDQVIYRIEVEKRWDDGGGPRFEVSIT